MGPLEHPNPTNTEFLAEPKSSLLRRPAEQYGESGVATDELETQTAPNLTLETAFHRCRAVNDSIQPALLP